MNSAIDRLADSLLIPDGELHEGKSVVRSQSQNNSRFNSVKSIIQHGAHILDGCVCLCLCVCVRMYVRTYVCVCVCVCVTLTCLCQLNVYRHIRFVRQV